MWGLGWGDKEPPIWILIVGLTIKLEACSAHKAGIVINYSHKAWPSSASSFLQASGGGGLSEGFGVILEYTLSFTTAPP